MFAIAQSFRLAFRQLRKTPGFTLTAVLTLALGIGATTAVFSLVEGILLRPLPFKDANRLVLLGDHLGADLKTPVTAREIGTYTSATRAFSSIGAYTTTSYELSGGSTPEEVRAARLTASVFSTLGVRPILGRVFTSQEENAHQPFAVLSYSLWLNRYHRDPHVLGHPMVLDRKSYTVIGVMPRDFEFPLQTGHLDQTQLWVPMSLTATELSEENTGLWGYHMVARLKNGVPLSQAVQDAHRVARQITREFPAGMSAIHIRADVTPLLEYAVADVRPLLRTLFFSVCIVLLIACVNVAGLLLVRAIRRRREYAIRLALGASSGVVIRESIFEGLLLSVAGGLLGLGFASATIRVALHLLPESMPRVQAVSMDGSVVAFAMLVAVVTGALCTLAPAFVALQTNLTESLKEGVAGGTGGSSHSWLRTTLVVLEIAIALMLLTAAGAFLRSFQKMRGVDPGFRPDHVLVAGFQLPLTHYRTHPSVDAFNRAVIDRLSTKPGVLAAGITNGLPGSASLGGAAFTIEGVAAASWKLQFAMFAATSGEYFRAMDIPLLDGRTFTRKDGPNAPPVVIVNQSMARHCWPDQRAIGKRMHVGNPKKAYPWATVVGIVADTKVASRDRPSTDQFYIPAEQPATLYGAEDSENLTGAAGGYITVRSALPPEQMIRILRSTVAEVDPLLALQQVQPMRDVLSNVEAPRRFNTGLITVFALGALMLAIIGMYAVIAFSVSLRAQEIAIRMALGAPRARIAKLIVMSGVKLAVLGCCLGLLGSFALSRFIRAFLFGVSATDPLIYVVAASIMILVALFASVLPAIRAAGADPIAALRAN